MSVLHVTVLSPAVRPHRVQEPEAGRVVALGVASAGGAPVEPREALDLVTGRGVDGDRYAAGKGTWERFPDREVTLIEAEAADAVAVADPLLLRRNIVTRGVSLNDLVGRRFRVGTVLLEGVRLCDPCGYLEKLLARPGLKRDLENRGGLRARILEGGAVRVGDAVTFSKGQDE